jgi:hypothetical protein
MLRPSRVLSIHAHPGQSHAGQSSIQMRAVEQSVTSVSASSALVLVLRDSQRHQSHVAHSREILCKHSLLAVPTDDLLLHDTRDHHDPHLPVDIFANVLHELDHALTSVDDPVRQNNSIITHHMLRPNLLGCFAW